jgi:3',5'-cyclic AMP phosphodiesterase CpdA
MNVVVQRSDTHFGTERPAVVEALVDWVRRQSPGLLVLSGDITQRARRAQFAAARAFVDRLGVPRVLAIPGNHDLPLFDPVARMFRPDANYRRTFGDDLEPRHVSDGLRVAAVRTTRRWRHVDGEVSAAQVERIGRCTAQADDARLRIVVVHQPIGVPRPQDAHDRLHGHERAVRRWSAAGVDLVLGGHSHLPCVLALHDRVAGLPRRMGAVQAGTAVSARTRREAPDSVNLIRWPDAGVGRPAPARPSPRCCAIERWDCVDPARGFECVSVDTVVPDREAPRDG